MIFKYGHIATKKFLSMDPSNTYASPLSIKACRCPHLEALLPQEIDWRLILDDSRKRRKRKGAEVIQQLHFLPFLDPASNASANGTNNQSTKAHYVPTANDTGSLSVTRASKKEAKSKPGLMRTFNTTLRHPHLSLCVNDLGPKTKSKTNITAKNDQDEKSLQTNDESEICNLSLERYQQLRQAEEEAETENISPDVTKSTEDPSSASSKSEKKNYLKRKRRHHEQVLEAIQVSSIVDLWLDVFRKSRRNYWTKVSSRKTQAKVSRKSKLLKPFGRIDSDLDLYKEQSNVESLPFYGDEVMQCLESSKIGSGPLSSNFSAKDNLMCHFVTSGHNFGVTCGSRCELFCMRCGDFIYHPIFDREKLNVDLSFNLPWLSWKQGVLNRSIDLLHPIQMNLSSSKDDTSSLPLFRLKATYPCDASDVLMKAGRKSLTRYQLFHGYSNVSFNGETESLKFMLRQKNTDKENRCTISAPVGIFNLGNTCYMNCILQCLIHCAPLQKYFLEKVGHDHLTSQFVREQYLLEEEQVENNKKLNTNNSKSVGKPKYTVCIASEMDRLFLRTFGSTININVIEALEKSLPKLEPMPEAPSIQEKNAKGKGSNDNSSIADKSILFPSTSHCDHTTCNATSSPEQSCTGSPLIPVRFLSAAWNSAGLTHLAGYEQRDAHEFLQALLDTMGKHVRSYQDLLVKNGAQPCSLSDERIDREEIMHNDRDIVRKIFEGRLRSVLLCDRCGCKRTQPEPFNILSLPIMKRKGKNAPSNANKKSSNVTNANNSSCSLSPNSMPSRRGVGNISKLITLQNCLEQFTEPEVLADPVMCPSCGIKTPTQKQHTFAKLPKVLCLHLKRFDASNTNKKITDPVTFPRELEMGDFLPHWCEVGQGMKTSPGNVASSPQLKYELFATVNHQGNLHQGHYVANVNVKNKWYTCNDAFVSECEIQTLEEDAYILFYIRK